MTTIAIINACTTITDIELHTIAVALQRQATYHWKPHWGSGAKIVYVPKGAAPPPGAWWLSALDNSDVAGALGYHDVTNEGQPLGKAFVGTDLQYGYSPSVTLSHELVEMLGDPDINLTVFDESGAGGRLWAYESADACEADKLGYKANVKVPDGSGAKVDVLLSDFVFPDYFQSFAPGPYDYGHHISEPFEILPGGYMSYYDIRTGSGWQQVSAEAPADPAEAFRAIPPKGSRRERRDRVWKANLTEEPTPTFGRLAKEGGAKPGWIPSTVVFAGKERVEEVGNGSE